MPTVLNKLAKVIFFVACLAALSSIGIQQPLRSQEPDRPESISRRIEPFIFATGTDIPRLPPPNHVPKQPGPYSRDDWTAVIDETWGPGFPTEVKIEMFEGVFAELSSEYACYQNLDLSDSDWFALGDSYLADISADVSRGHFAGILSHLVRRLKDGHAYYYYDAVSYTELLPGVPLMWTGCWGEQGHFGAAVTPTLDGDLLVYRVAPDHPLGLEPGDIIIGYDGVPWPELAAELIEAELPLATYSIAEQHLSTGSCESASDHAVQGAVGMNWHLFDEIDVRKFDTGETISLATSLLSGQNRPVWCNEQMPIDDVPYPFPFPDQMVTWDTVPHGDLEVGYIYVAAWYTLEAGAQFAQAVADLWNTDALIIDQRFNMGGLINAPLAGCALLFDTNIDYMYAAHRCGDANNLYEMCQSDYTMTIHGSPGSYYDKPIALLLGPGCVSMGDAVAFIFTHHPHARSFGRSTNMSNSTPRSAIDPPIRGRYAYENSYVPPQTWPPDEYVSHLEFDIDREVWLTPEDVAQGIDTVVETALAWIDTAIIEVGIPEPIAQLAALDQNHPNPFNPSTIIAFSLPDERLVDLTVYALDGTRVASLLHEARPAGRHSVAWDGEDGSGRPVASGTYLYRIQTGDFTESRAMTLVR